MESHSFPAVFCVLCNEAVNLRIDVYADENGKPIHEDCYVRRITNRLDNPLTTAIGD
jgi:hypothetical protein